MYLSTSSALTLTRQNIAGLAYEKQVKMSSVCQEQSFHFSDADQQTSRRITMRPYTPSPKVEEAVFTSCTGTNQTSQVDRFRIPQLKLSFAARRCVVEVSLSSRTLSSSKLLRTFHAREYPKGMPTHVFVYTASNTMSQSRPCKSSWSMGRIRGHS